MKNLVLLALIVAAGTACSSAYYGTLEKFGIEKRDILVERVDEASDAQDDAKEQFADALEQFRSVVAVDGGELEETYDRLKKDFEASEARAATVSERIDAVEAVAEDLFDEWEDELDLYNDARLRRNSARQLDETRQRYTRLQRAMRQAESRMAPVLDVFRDQVLYLKHNLNARAIASLRTELTGIEGDVERLIQAMDQSIAEARSFISSMEPD
ncbi:MAG: DUF2959 domain-containing protein [Wenzhouxiangellaceae bacterium]